MVNPHHSSVWWTSICENPYLDRLQTHEDISAVGCLMFALWVASWECAVTLLRSVCSSCVIHLVQEWALIDRQCLSSGPSLTSIKSNLSLFGSSFWVGSLMFGRIQFDSSALSINSLCQGLRLLLISKIVLPQMSMVDHSLSYSLYIASSSHGASLVCFR